MSERLPVHIDPVTAADRRRELHGHVPVQALDRLGQWLHSQEGALTVSLYFGRGASGRRILTAEIRGDLELECERCLRAYDLPLDLSVELVMVENEAEAKTLPDDAEPLVVGDARSMHTTDMIEDDLILALPVVPRCRRSDCQTAVQVLDSEEAEEDGGAGRQRPFADLDLDG